MEKECHGVHENTQNTVAEDRGGCCEELITEGEDVNSLEQLGWTPLMQTVLDGNTELVRDLVSQGAQVSQVNNFGITAFTMATLNCNEDLLKTLYDSLSPERRQQESNVALLVGCTRGSYSTVKWLLGTTLAQADYVSPLIGVTPLMMVAMTSGDCDIAKLLMEKGADPTTKSALGQDVSEIALATGNDKLFSLLNPVSPLLKKHSSFERVGKTNCENIDPMFTTNKINLGNENHTVLINSPSRPLFKTSAENVFVKSDIKSPLCHPKRSVFLLSPQRRFQTQNSDDLNCRYNLTALVTPRKGLAKTPTKGKRKLSNGISSWFKKIAKRRSKSLADEDDYKDMNIQQENGVEFLKMLESLGLEEFFPIFKEQELDIWTFLSLTVQDLAAMGIDKASAQIRILAGIQTLRTTQI